MTEQTSEDTPERQEQIAAARLLLAVKFFAVPGARTLPYVREDVEGLKDIERFADEVEALVLVTVPDGFGGTQRIRKHAINRWLNGCEDPAGEKPIDQIGRAAQALEKEGADPTACRKLWDSLEMRAR